MQARWHHDWNSSAPLTRPPQPEYARDSHPNGDLSRKTSVVDSGSPKVGVRDPSASPESYDRSSKLGYTRSTERGILRRGCSSHHKRSGLLPHTTCVPQATLVSRRLRSRTLNVINHQRRATRVGLTIGSVEVMHFTH